MSAEASVLVAVHVTHGPEEVENLRAQVVTLLALVQDAYHDGFADGCESPVAWSPEATEAAWAGSAACEMVKQWQEEE